MAEEEKELLFKDICTRMPYGLYVQVGNEICSLREIDCEEFTFGVKHSDGHFSRRYVDEIKIYLRPMSSMTDDEKKEIEEILEHSFHVTDKGNIVSNDWRDGAVFTSQYDAFKIMDFCNKHHLDCRELIPTGLAIEAPEGMYEK